MGDFQSASGPPHTSTPTAELGLALTLDSVVLQKSKRTKVSQNVVLECIREGSFSSQRYFPRVNGPDNTSL